jgi:ribosomal protein S18 acetylase RimI-like enzyme
MSSATGVVEVRPAENDEVERVVDPIVLAFATDPIMRWFFPEPHKFLTAFPAIVRAVAKPAFDSRSAHCVEGFVGGALWLPPGVNPDGPSIAAVLEENIEPNRLAEVMAFIQEKNQYHPDEPLWYLHMIGVDPRAQSKGYGSAMLRYALEQVDAAHAGAYLESTKPENVPIYERYGFETIAIVKVGSSPPIVPMLRPAR